MFNKLVLCYIIVQSLSSQDKNRAFTLQERRRILYPGNILRTSSKNGMTFTIYCLNL